MTIWERLQNLNILKRSEQPYIAAECSRFKSDQAFEQYMDEAKMNIIQRLWELDAKDVEGFLELKKFQLALDGFNDFIDTAITSEIMKNKREQGTTPQGR